MKHLHLIIFSLILSLSGFAQKKNKSMEGIWFAGKTIMDPKVGVIKLKRVGHDDMGHGTFIWFKDSVDCSLYYSPMCGNDCVWNYTGKYSADLKKLTIKFNAYSQHGFCKTMQKTYSKSQMKFVFLVEPKGKDTLVLTRQSK